jgi:hypothetical protein
VLVLLLVLGDPDVSDRITEQNNCEAIGSFRCRKRRRIEHEHEHDPLALPGASPYPKRKIQNSKRRLSAGVR